MLVVEKKCLHAVTLEVESNLKTHLQMRPNYLLSQLSLYVSQMKIKPAMNYFSAFPALTLRSIGLSGPFIVVGTLYLLIYPSLYKDRARLCAFIKVF